VALVDCPKCSSKLPPPFKSSGRQVCSSCGWTDKQSVAQENVSGVAMPLNPASLASDQPNQPRGFSTSELTEIAKYQKMIIWLILIGMVLPFIHPSLSILSSVIQAIFVYNLAVAMRSQPAAIYCFLMFIPLVGLITLLVLNGNATSILKTNGIAVGLMGANPSDIARLANEE
jgi:hypothetical protein